MGGDTNVVSKVGSDAVGMSMTVVTDSSPDYVGKDEMGVE